MIRTERYDMSDPEDALRARQAAAAPEMCSAIFELLESARTRAKHDDSKVGWDEVREWVLMMIGEEAAEAAYDDVGA